MGNGATKPKRQRIAEAQKTGVLVLSELGLKKFSKKSMRLGPTLRSLDLSKNHISKVPASVSVFVALKTLVLSENGITSLPNEMGSLTHLQTLILDFNQLSALNGVSKLSALKTLSAVKNVISVLPEFNGLEKLEVLNLASNKIEKLPESIGMLKSVIDINLEHNAIKELPLDWSGCRALKVLLLNHNQLSKALPISLLKSTPVARLELENNPLDELDLVKCVDGYEQYETRRKLRIDKGLQMVNNFGVKWTG
mmetsp:Transcript_22374/g.37488  ORF Transcript_22374/g.37488 Transcript_22374/m.37488 type:complete len:253 (-) Transcript_22374:4-762(-)